MMEDPPLHITVEPIRELSDWQVARTAPGLARSPDDLADLEWLSCESPADALSDLPEGSQVDDWDLWFRTRCAPWDEANPSRLEFDGLASLVEIWVDGRLLSTSRNMFRRHLVELDTTGTSAVREVHLACRSLTSALRQRRPRGRWPVRLVSEKNLRFFRTSLLGFLPGFCPRVRPVGPFRPSRIVATGPARILGRRLRTDWHEGTATLEVETQVRVTAGEIVSARIEIEGVTADLEVCRATGSEAMPGDHVLSGVLQGRFAPWTPHTHGSPALHDAILVLDTTAGLIRLELGRVGFRRIEVDRREGAFELMVNGQPVFARGAAWMPLDLRTLDASEPTYRRALHQVCSAGMNMLRVPGVSAYETDTFYRLCDEMGILVWQDFMFANFDYPCDEPGFVEECESEARDFLDRTSERACLTVLCGGSEVAQQAAMMGMTSDQWSNTLFDEVLPGICGVERPDVTYIPSSPSGGTLPFHSRVGPSHYYGVGAYLRPFSDARTTMVRFASECLAFSIPPCEERLRSIADRALETIPVSHAPDAKAAVPRDPGAGWDFSDVTDHYLEQVFDVRARALRSTDPERYRALSRAAVSESMQQVFGLWRRPESGCGGALVWTLRDLVMGAGWGLIDASGTPKAPYHALRRALSPESAWFVDDGLDGLALHIASERNTSSGTAQVTVFRQDGSVLIREDRQLTIGPDTPARLEVEGLLGRFIDATYAYRFGPPAFSLIHASWTREGSRTPTSEAFFVPGGLGEQVKPIDLGLTAKLHRRGDGYDLTVRARRFALAIDVEAPGYDASDRYFHLAPDLEREIRLTRVAGAAPPARTTELRSVRLRALNGHSVLTVMTGSIGEDAR